MIFLQYIFYLLTNCLFKVDQGYLQPPFPPRYFLSYNNNDEENHLARPYLNNPSLSCQKNR